MTDPETFGSLVHPETSPVDVETFSYPAVQVSPTPSNSQCNGVFNTHPLVPALAQPVQMWTPILA